MSLWRYLLPIKPDVGGNYVFEMLPISPVTVILVEDGLVVYEYPSGITGVETVRWLSALFHKVGGAA